MRTKHLLLFFAVLVTGGFTAMKTVTSDWDQSSTVKESVEQFGETRLMDVAKGEEFSTSDLQAVRLQLKTALNSQASGSLNWRFLGPNNVAGRMRAIVIDRQNPHVMYAGSASGGIYKTETNGQYWYPVATNYNAGVVSVTSMVQGPDNTIYATTGEAFDSFKMGTQDAKSYAGVGVFKLSPGETEFKHLESTDPIINEDFFGIIELAVDPNNSSTLYITTWKGAYQSLDGGASWNIINGLPVGYATGVQVSENGTVIISVSHKVFVNNGEGFVQVSGVADGMIDTGGIRFKFAFAPSQADYVYAIGADSVGVLLGVYRSTQKGAPETWETIGLGGSESFALFTRKQTIRAKEVVEREGLLSMAIAVSANDEDYVYIGGMDLWAGYKIPEVGPFQWMRKTYYTMPKYLSSYLTSNIHEIVEHPNGNLFIATDGGMFRFNDQTLAVKMSSYLTTAQAYSVAFGPKGEIAMGTEDNGIWYNDFSGNESQMFSGREIIRTDDFNDGATHGFQTLLSQVTPELIYYQHSDARFYKSYDLGGSAVRPYSDEVIIKSTPASWTTRNSQLAMWESHDYPYGHDSYTYKTFKDLYPGDVDTIESYNIARAPIYRTIGSDEFYPEDTLVPFVDPYKQILAYGVKGRIWLTRAAASIQEDVRYGWYDVFSVYNYYSNPPFYNAIAESKIEAEINDITFSHNGHHIYFTTSFKNDTVEKYEIFRLDSIHTVLNRPSYSWSVATLAMSPDTVPNDILLPYTQKLGTVYGREITSVIIDPNANREGNLVITLSGYDNEDKVYYCPQANTTKSTSFSANFRPIQGNLPKIPVFTGVVDVTKDKKLILGTEVGVWSTTNYTKLAPTWAFDNNGVGALPVTQIKQQQLSMADYPNVENYGNLYMSTYGGGIFVDSSSFVPRAKDELEPTETTQPVTSINVNVYPNPVNASLNLGVVLVIDGDVTVSIYNMAGQIVYKESMGAFAKGMNNCRLDVSDFNKGVYFAKVSSGDQQDVVKFVKR